MCLGNICRSPVAEAALRAEITAAGLADRVEIDSAGTGDWNLGKPPNPRMRAAASAIGLELDGIARQITADDLRHHDLILVMDHQNLADVRALAPDDETRAQVRLFLEYAGQPDTAVPDPYFGEDEGFTHVVDVVTDAARTIAATLRTEVAAGRPA